MNLMALIWEVFEFMFYSKIALCLFNPNVSRIFLAMTGQKIFDITCFTQIDPAPAKQNAM